MKTLTITLYKFSHNCLKWLTLCLTLFLFAGGALMTCYATDMVSQEVLTSYDKLLVTLPLSALLLLVFGILLYLLRRNFSLYKPVLLGIVILWTLLFGIVLVLFSKTVPAADAYSVYAIAEALALGDTSVIHHTDSYLSYYPQQVGLVAFFELLIRIWNLFAIDMPAYHFIKGIYVLILCAAIFFQYKSVHLLWKNDSVDCIYLLLAGSNLPLMMYASFVYGEIPSFAAFSVGLYYLLCLFEQLKVHSTPATRKKPCLKLYFNIGATIIFLTLSVMLRKNALILIIATTLVLFLEWLKTRHTTLLITALLCVLCAISVLPLTQKYYELRSHNTLSNGVTATSYLAMGMQESSRGNGWYNGFNFNTFQETGMNQELTNEISQKAIEERLSYFQANPDYAVSFYLGKHLSQWADGTYASRQATLATFGGRHEFFVSLYEGELSYLYIAYCNIYQNILYFGSFIFCVKKSFPFSKRKKETGNTTFNFPEYLGLIGVIGGFLFHIIWEANSRYIFVYGLLLMPYAAKGIAIIFQGLQSLKARESLPR